MKRWPFNVDVRDTTTEGGNNFYPEFLFPLITRGKLHQKLLLSISEAFSPSGEVLSTESFSDFKVVLTPSKGSSLEERGGITARGARGESLIIAICLVAMEGASRLPLQRRQISEF